MLGTGFTILCTVAMKRDMKRDRVSHEQRPRDRKKVRTWPPRYLGEGCSGSKGNSRFQGPSREMCLVCKPNSKETKVIQASLKRVRGGVGQAMHSLQKGSRFLYSD